MTEIITTLHPENDENTNLYPNIKKDNIPSKSIDTSKLSDNVLSMIGSLKPSGTDTSTNILAKTTNQGIWVATDNGHWYYWNGDQYVDGGVYQATTINDGSVTYPKLDNNLKDAIDLWKFTYISKNKFVRGHIGGGNFNFDTSDGILSIPLKVSDYLGKKVTGNSTYLTRIGYSTTESAIGSCYSPEPLAIESEVKNYDGYPYFRVMILVSNTSLDDAYNKVKDVVTTDIKELCRLYINAPQYVNDIPNMKLSIDDINNSLLGEYILKNKFVRGHISGGLFNFDTSSGILSIPLKVSDYLSKKVTGNSTYLTRIGYSTTESASGCYSPEPLAIESEVKNYDGYPYFRVMILVSNTSLDDAYNKVKDVVTTDIKELCRLMSLQGTISQDTIIERTNSSGGKILTWIDDDTGSGIIDVIDVCEEVGCKCSLACITENVDDSKLALLKSYYDKGFEICNHSGTHNRWYRDDLFDLEGYQEDMMKAINFFANNNFEQGYEYFVYPGGSFLIDNARFVIEKWCKCAVRADGRNNGVNILSANGRYDIDRLFVTPNNSASYYTNILDSVSNENAWIVFGTHSSIENAFDKNQMKTILNYAINNGWKIVTLNHGFRIREKFYLQKELGLM